MNLDENISAVITGGAAQVRGLAQLAEQTLNMPVRIGQPANIKGLGERLESPVYSTAVGLLIYGLNQQDSPKVPYYKKKGFFRLLTSWFRKNL